MLDKLKGKTVKLLVAGQSGISTSSSAAGSSTIAAYIQVFGKLVDFDKEFVDFYFYRKKDLNMKYYDFMDIERGLEFADLVFEKNIDKMNFLRQYFKNFDLDNNKQKFIK